MKSYELSGVEYPFRVAAQMVFHRTITMLQLNATEEEIRKMCDVLNKMLLSEDLTPEDLDTVEKMSEKYKRG